MKIASRFTLFIFILCLIVFVGLVFSGWVVPNIVEPAAQTIWLFLRVFILSTAQVYYWVLLGLAVVILVSFRLRRIKPAAQPEGQTVRNEAVENLKNWQDVLVSSQHATSGQGIARDKLLRMVVDHYSNRQIETNQGDIVRSLEQRRLPLPDSVHNYLFTSETVTTDGTFPQVIRRYIYRLSRRFTGKDEAEFNQMIDELVDFLKT